MDKQRYDIMIGMQAGELAAGVKSAKKDLKELKQAIKDTQDVLNTSPERFGQKLTGQLETARAKAAQLVKEVEKLQRAGKISLFDSNSKRGPQATPKQSAQIMAGVSDLQSSISAARPAAIDEKRAKADRELQNRSITLRYALYDVAAATQQASQTMMQYASASLMAAAAQEKAFSQIQKTLIGDVSTEELENLRQELVALSTTIPVSFTELTKIGMLGSQLGINAGDISKFTEVVAKFTAITGMSVDEAAMGFGKLQNLLGLNGEQFEALGSAIAKVGVESAATEQQIINTAGQFAAVAKAAGFSASEIIGLSASFASLKIAPEETRGVIVRTFSEMSTAVASFSNVTQSGNERLARFAQIAGISAKDFAAGWSDKNGGASDVFEKFVRGLAESDIPKELRAIGLDGIRTSKGLTALASDVNSIFGSRDKIGAVGEEIKGTIDIAREAGLEGTFLDVSFGAIVEDLASKVEMLKNSFENLLASAAGDEDFLNLIGGLVDGITRFNDILTRASQNSEFFRGFVQATIVISALGAAFLGLLAVFALSGAGFAAMRTAFVALQSMFGGLSGAIALAKAQLLGMVPATTAGTTGFVGMGIAARGAATGIFTAAGALRAFKIALASTGIGLAVVIFGELAASFMQAADESENGVTGLDELTGALDEQAQAAAAAKSELMAFIKQGLEPIADSVKAQDSLFNLGKALRENGQDWSEYSEGGRNNISVLQSTIESFVTAFGGDAQVLANNLLALREYMIQMGMGGAIAFDMLDLAIAETGTVAQKAVVNFSSLDAGLRTVSTSAGKAQSALEKMTKAFEKAFEELDARTDLEDSFDAFGESLEENGKAVNTFTETGRSNFKSLRDVIFSLKDGLAGNPQSLANTLASLRQAMIRVGITSQTAFEMVDNAIKATGRNGSATGDVIEAMVNTINQAAEASKKLTTITDYVGDLSSVLSDALNNRYARQDARDSISSAWDAISESAQEARRSIDEANASINDMRSNRNILEYQLRVAVRYGDTLRAEAIRAQIARTDSDIAKEQEKITEAQEVTNKTLIGNSKSAIDNRSTVRDLVGSYNDYLASLAATGISSEVLNAKAAELSNEFLEQGVQMGFAREELLDYTDAFKKDFTTVINNLPKNIVLNVNADPAKQAVIDFVKSTNAELARILSVTPSINLPTTSIPSVPINTGNNTSNNNGPGPAPAPAPVVISDGDRVRAAMGNTKVANEVRRLAGATSGTADSMERKINSFLEKITKAQADAILLLLTHTNSGGGGGSGFTMKASGGYISGPGTGTSDSIPTMLSNGEYVLKANAVKYYGTDFMNSLNQMQVQMGAGGASSGGTSGVVYLSPEDRALLRSAIDRPISLYTENTTIASTANAGNVLLAQRGSR
jgi:TP901 family phage tail tape measure protein